MGSHILLVVRINITFNSKPITIISSPLTQFHQHLLKSAPRHIIDLANANPQPTYLRKSKRGVTEFLVNSVNNQKRYDMF
uniref:Uncharacterized protein n=1 Tax=Gossypium raimondii TaxID=29730 RepID=A0A0D2RMF7_GOSRA|nr:hypothetical protein B456_005G160100 [Gossypium raimondii]